MPAATSPVTIRQAEPGDEAALIGLVRELAEFERATDQVQADAGDLARALFGPEPVASAHVALDPVSDAAVGMALWYPTFSTWTGRPGMHLEDLYVRPSARGRGVGRTLLRTLAAHCLAHGWARLEWAVLDWNAQAIGFYQAVGANALTDWQTYRLTGSALHSLASEADGAAAHPRAGSRD